MTQEDKDLLFKDLCGRLPYGVKVKIYNHWRDDYDDKTLTLENYAEWINTFSVKDIKPYLFPISSMTMEQAQQWHKYANDRGGLAPSTDWLDAHHFDYRGLIPMGLANDATGKNIY